LKVERFLTSVYGSVKEELLTFNIQRVTFFTSLKDTGIGGFIKGLCLG